MNHSELILLMHAVLDGEATADETRELRRILADSPSAREQFDELRRLFDELRLVPRAFPPEGLVAAVMAQVPRRRSHTEPIRQLFTRSRVIGASSLQTRGGSPGQANMAERAPQPRPYLGGDNMTEKRSSRSSLNKRGVWIGLGVTAVAVALAVQFGVDFPPGGKDVTGTIVPAQRYRADQPTAADVNVGAPSGGSGSAVSGNAAATDAARSDAARSVDAAKVDASRSVDAAKVDASRSVDAAKVDASRSVDAAKFDASRSADAAKTDASRSVDAAKVDASRSVDAAKVDAARGADAAKIDSARAAKVDAARGADASKIDAARAAKTDAARGDALKSDAAKKAD